MSNKRFITCAVTGAGDSVGRTPHIPVTPSEIAAAAVEAARAGAAVVHIHVRDPQTGQGCRDPELFKQTVGEIRSSGVDAVINLTAGMGGDLVLGGVDAPLPAATAGTDMAGALERLAHVEELLPEICTLDCGSMNFAAGGDYVMVNTPAILRTMAQRVRTLGVRPELEVFDSGHLVFVRELVAQNLLDSPYLVQLCMGIPYGAPARLEDFVALRSNLPENCVWSSFAIGRMEMAWVALTAMAGGNVRVGLEDNLYLSKGVPATNAQLVTRAAEILDRTGFEVMTAAEVRTLLNLKTPA